MGLRSEVVDLGGLDGGYDVHQIRAIGEIAVMQLEFIWALRK